MKKNMSIKDILKRILKEPPGPLECLEKEMTIGDAKKYYYDDIKKLLLPIPENQNLLDDAITNLEPRWEKFKSKFRAGDKLFLYNTPKEYWDRMSGRRGFVILRNKRIVAKFQYILN